jgi:[NiFe] hydrogenase assembly HybE family chaperone
MADIIAGLVHQFELIHREHMRDLPIVNPALKVEAVGFEGFEDHQLGVLITPWFMNLVLLPGNDEWATAQQGDMSTIGFPSGPIEFTCCHDTEIGTYLSAVLFRSVLDVPDQPMAREVARRVMKGLFVSVPSGRKLSRRALLTGLTTD